MNNQRIAIIGCGRSGTQYSSRVLIKAGLDIGHETYGKQGESDWKLTAKSLGDLKKDYSCILHQVRDPLKVIYSCHTFYKTSWQLVYKTTEPGGNRKEWPLWRGMKYWYRWNLLAEKKAIFTYRVEDFDAVFYEILNLFGISKSNQQLLGEDALVVSKTINTRYKRRWSDWLPEKMITWEDMRSADEDLTEKIWDLATSYGYDCDRCG